MNSFTKPMYHRNIKFSIQITKITKITKIDKTYRLWYDVNAPKQGPAEKTEVMLNLRLCT